MRKRTFYMCKKKQDSPQKNKQSLISKFRSFTYMSSEENMTFIQMLLITFVITVCMTLVTVLLVFDHADFPSSDTSRNFQFSFIENLDHFTFLASTIIQTVVPTTITFSGTILILQSRSNMNRTYKVLLFISIILMALFGIMQNYVKSFPYLVTTNVVLFVLIVLAIYFSKKVFNLKNYSLNKKKETSDGTPVADF